MEDTIAAISTSTVSSGGISIVRISGPDAIIIGDKVFKSKKNINLANVQSHTVHFGNICDNGNEIDEALVIVMKALTLIQERILLRLTVMAVFLLLRRC